MPCIFKKFESTDIFHNTVIAYPEYDFLIYNKEIFINDETKELGDFSNSVKHIPQGYISLYELNVNRPSTSLVSSFVTKEGSRAAFKTISTVDFNNSSLFPFGATMTASYPLSASISRIYIDEGPDVPVNNSVSQTTVLDNKKYVRALEASLESNARFSKHYAYTSSSLDVDWDKGFQKINMICIPSIFYGSGIKKGSLELNMYVTGTLSAQLKDENSDGELIQTFGDNESGSVAGVVLYEQGLILLTGSWALDQTHTEAYDNTNSNPTWLNFGSGIPLVGTGISLPTNLENSAFQVKFKGITKTPTLLMMTHADKGEFNYSNNPTFIESDNQPTASVTTKVYREGSGKIKNTVKSRFNKHEEKFDSRTYISKIGIYDENYNLIALAKLANPVKKTENRGYTFKLKIDL
jgi:hypothetical protein